MGIGRRLLLLLAIPLTALLVVTGYGVARGASQAREASELTQRTDLALRGYELVEDLQAERQMLVTEDATTPELSAAVRESSAAMATQASQVGGALAASTEAALRRVAAAQSVAERELGGAVALRVYSDAVHELLDVATVAIDPRGAIDDAAAASTDYLARAQAAAAEERDLVTVLTADDTLDALTFQEVMSLASAQSSYIELAAASSPPALAIQIRQVGFANSAADTVRRAVFDTAPDRAPAWIAGLDARAADLAELQRTAEARAVAAVDQLARNSRLLFATAALAAVAILLSSALLLRRAIRSIARPLQELATQAEDVARVRLPDAVATQQLDGVEAVHLPALRATGAAEVHEVAAAFNEVQDTALRLASEQAALRRNQGEALTNLGRRNQTLLARQLDFISSLETRETDPAFLDHLFKLDHLASRMRRNAESLLILAGSETPRRRRTPAPISEIVRAAMSEVEEFERVRIGNVRDATIAGPAVIDLIHLLAELIENALAFSPPDSTVEIDGRSLGQGGYQFAVIDHGVGMSDVELMAANHRLRGLDEIEGMPTRYLGQYVVAKLAAKTSAMVRLQPSAGGRGVTALVILPTSALVGERDRSAVAQPLPGSRAAREQGPVPFAPGAAVAPAVEAPVGAGDPAASVDGGDWFAMDPQGVDDPDLGAPVDAYDPEPGSLFDAVEALDPPSDVEETGSLFDAPVGSLDPLDPPPAVADVEVIEVPVIDDDPPTAVPDPLAPDPFAVDPFAVGQRDAEPQPVEEVVAELVDVAPWLADGPPESAAADPWHDFLAEPSLDEIPPPAPPVAPVQAGWVPAAEHAPASLPSEEIDPPAPSRGEDTPADGAVRAGGLTRRVPGATLAESRGQDVGGTAAPVAGRSADGVRSMLSSFQAGRQRGRDLEPDGPTDSTSTISDGRIPQ